MEDPIKHEIIKISESLFNQFGLKSVSMDDVASKMGVSKKTLYKFFKSKDDLIQTVLLSKFEEMESCVMIPCSLNLDAIEEVLSVFKNVLISMSKTNPAMLFDLKKYYPSIYQLHVQFMNDKVKQHFLANLKKGVEAGYYRSDLNPELMSNIYFNMIEYILGPESAEIEPEFSKRYEHLFFYHMRGVTTEKGLKKLESVKQTN